MVVQSVSISREDWAYIINTKKSPTFLLRLGAKIQRILDQESQDLGLDYALTLDQFLERKEKAIAKLNQRLVDALDQTNA